MLQVKDLRKEYVTDKSVITKALDGVTLDFPETGMVFILGKSGSGKSTLLNLCGGLDKVTSGEIIINGKSSKNFTGKDFDSYRNTFVGFVFQEYNVLEDYTVAENVALAMELQGKKRNREEIASILNEVEMAELASRKSGTLSGGQKQRVAIARAIVKQPEIILADEPTGALDSETGTQIFELLKKLSASRLVLVVSHDRDFAEQYADRIIELKDGKVDSDVVCTEGKEDKKEVSQETGAAIEPLAERKETEFIRARLPFKHVLRMGFKSLKGKPVRFAFSIILCIFAFVLLGLSSTLMFYSEKSVVVETMRLSPGNYVTVGKGFETRLFYHYNDGRVEENGDSLRKSTGFTVEEYEQFQRKYPDALAKVSFFNEPYNFELSSDTWDYYGTIDQYVIANPSLKVLAGRLPAASDEIAIPEFLFNAMKLEQTKFVFVTEEDVAAGQLVNESAPKHTVSTYEDVLYSQSNPATIFVNGGAQTFNFKIVGVYQSDKEPAAYKSLKRAVENGEDTDTGDFPEQSSAWSRVRDNGFYSYFALSTEFLMEYGHLYERKPVVFEPHESEHSWEEYQSNYTQTPDSIIDGIILKHSHNLSKLNRIVGLAYEKHADDSYFTVNSPVLSELNQVNRQVGLFRNAFLYAGLGLTVFAFLLMFNLISVSVITKKKDIGILRALGARSLDVFFVFFVEALMIALVSSVAAFAFSAIICYVLDIMMIKTIKAAIFVFGIFPMLFILGIAALTSFLATLIPVANYTKKSPVESIRMP
ncbi:MAG: ATP-binding cassette domain-containing protein [Clostridia bacterium]|nr:ATP-binding cassette domain-containing protein [Clostridia bacterium]